MIDTATVQAPPQPSAPTFSPIEPEYRDTAKWLRQVLDDFKASQDFLTPLFPKWLRYYKVFRNYVAPRSRPWRANIAVPIGFANVEHGQALMMEQWNQRPVIQVYARGGEDYDMAKTVEGYLQWELGDIPAFLPIFDTSQDFLIYGTGWGKVFWDWERDRNTLESISPWNGYPDPSAESLNDAEFFIHRSLRSPSYIKQMIRLGVYDGTDLDVDAMAKEGLAWSEDADNLLNQVGLGSSATVKNRIEVLEDWREDPKCRITVFNRRHVARAGKNRFPHGRKPLIRFVDNAVSHELLGISEIEVIEKLVDAINDAESQKFDVVSLVINNVLLYNRMANIDPEELIMRPGQTVGMDGPIGDNVRALVQNMSGVPLADTEIARLRWYIQEGTGNWGYNQGQTPERRETATAVLALQRAAGARFAVKIRRNEEEALRDMASMMIVNAAKLGPTQKWIRIVGDDRPKQIEMDALLGEWDFVPTMSTAEPKDALRRRFVEILPLLQKMGRANDEGILDYVADLWQIPKEKLILTDEQMAAKMQQMALARMGAGNGQDPAQPPGGMPPEGMLPGGQAPESIEDVAQAGRLAQEMLGVPA